MNYAIFRSEPIYTLQDLAQIGSHNKREKKAYQSNPDIKLDKTKDNIELVPLAEKYVKGFYNITEDYRKEHDKRMKTERIERKKTFNQMLNSSKNVVADELMFTATNTFFKDMTREDIKRWADTCMDFVYEDLGYTKDQILHATVHLDEKTPHIHCVVVPLIKKLDKRTNTERYTISKKQYIKDKLHLSKLQDKYCERLNNNGFDLERGIRNYDNKHIKMKEYKIITRKLEHNLEVANTRLSNVMSELGNKMNTNKAIPFDKKHVIVEKETFDIMNKAITEAKKVMEIEPKLEKVFNDVSEYAGLYTMMNSQNKKYESEIKALKQKNNSLIQENKNLKEYIQEILRSVKQFFKKILHFGNDSTKEIASNQVKDYYDNKDFDKYDIVDIAKGTTKEDELFDYADVPSYYKSTKDYRHNDELER